MAPHVTPTNSEPNSQDSARNGINQSYPPHLPGERCTTSADVQVRGRGDGLRPEWAASQTSRLQCGDEISQHRQSAHRTPGPKDGCGLDSGWSSKPEDQPWRSPASISQAKKMS